jgi:hypothetical protein
MPLHPTVFIAVRAPIFVIEQFACFSAEVVDVDIESSNDAPLFRLVNCTWVVQERK